MFFALLVAIVVACFAVGKLLTQDKQRLASYKEDAIEVRDAFQALGFTIIPDLLKEVVSGDWPTFFGTLREIAKRIRKNPKGEVQADVQSALNQIVATDEGKKMIQAAWATVSSTPLPSPTVSGSATAA